MSLKEFRIFLQELVTNRSKIGPFQIEEMKNYFQMYGRVFHVGDNTIFNKVAVIKIKFLKKLVPNGWKSEIFSLFNKVARMEEKLFQK